MLSPFYDPMGQAIADFYDNQLKDQSIHVWCDVAEDDIISVDYLFRNYEDMPLLERQALSLCYGRVLDAGAGSGTHTLWLQHNTDTEPWAADISGMAVETMKKRGILRASTTDLLTESFPVRFDTILMMMNNIGICGTVAGYKHFLTHAADKLLAPGGQILFTSTDISYMYDTDTPDWLQSFNKYYFGEIVYRMSYGKSRSKKFKWLYIDERLACQLAEKHGYKADIISIDSKQHYLARLTWK